MSPERYRTHSEGWRKHLRDQRTASNRLARESFTFEQKQREMTAASWSAVKGLLNLSTFNNPKLRELYDDPECISVVREWYDASYKDATKNRENMVNRSLFQEKYTIDKKSEVYDPLLIRRIAPLLNVVDQALFKSTPTSK